MRAISAERRFEGTVAVVTGGGTGIGRATALRLGREGASVLVAGRRPEKLAETIEEIERSGGHASSLALDLRERETAQRLIAAALEWKGGLDAVVNAAGTFPSAPFAELPDPEWDEAIEINLAAPMRVARAAVPALRQRGGTIVNVSSISAVIGDEVSQCAHYSAAKAGLIGLTRQLAVELAPFGIRVNCVAPGAVATPMLEGWNDGPGEMRDWLARYVPLRRIAQPEEVAGAIAFLLSDDASYITGETLMVDGGMAVL